MAIEKTVTYTRVRNGKTQVVTRRRRAYEAGHKNDPTYGIWTAMKQRCSDPGADNYKWYGGKGVVVCPEWLDYVVFRNWAYANGYAPGLELDRKDSDGNYCADNCQWMTKKRNLRNRDLAWSDEVDQALITRAKEMGVSPYEIIRRAVESYLGSEVIG